MTTTTNQENDTMKTIIPNMQGGFVALPNIDFTAIEKLPVIAWEIDDDDGAKRVTPLTPLGDMTVGDPYAALWTGHGWIDLNDGIQMPGRTVEALLDFLKVMRDAK